MKIDKLSGTLLIIIAILIAIMLTTSGNSNEVDKYAKQKSEIDSLSKMIVALEKDQLKYDSLITQYKDSLVTIEHQIDSTKHKITQIQNYYGDKIKAIDNATHDELGNFFTNRYK
jgi:predicted  nucleic acid-binding Zn-ribbon protein